MLSVPDVWTVAKSTDFVTLAAEKVFLINENQPSAAKDTIKCETRPPEAESCNRCPAAPKREARAGPMGWRDPDFPLPRE